MTFGFTFWTLGFAFLVFMKTRMCLHPSHFLSLLARILRIQWFLHCVLFLSFLVQAGQCVCCSNALRDFMGFL